MVRQHTPEELAFAEKILKEAQPLFRLRASRESEEADSFIGDMEMLQRRVVDQYVNAPLPGGDSIRIHSIISREAEEKMDTLAIEQESIGKPDREKRDHIRVLIEERKNLVPTSLENVMRIEDITEEIKAIYRLTKEQNDRINEINYEVVEILTVDPAITKAWLKANPDKVSAMDINWIIAGYYEQKARHDEARQERINRAVSFRKEQGGARLR